MSLLGRRCDYARRSHLLFFLSLGRYLFHFTKLSCKPCEEGMFQVFHDLLRETHCCTNRHMCNTGKDNLEKSALYGEDADYTVHDDIPPK